MGARGPQARGYGQRRYPLDPARQACICRKLASDLRAEHAAGWGPITLTKDPINGGPTIKITRLEAAPSFEEQAKRWDAEARGEARNDHDRALIGCL